MISMAGTTQVYGAYGERTGSPVRSRSAFSGEIPETATGWYMLGERPYSPTLRRFISADAASPFELGGINRYAYCAGDPVNRIDPSGNTWLRWLGASQGLTETPGAGRSVSSGSRSTDAAATSPVAMTSSAAAVADAASITAAVDSVALMTSDRPRAGGVFGWVAAGAQATSGCSALPAARTGPPQERFVGAHGALARSGRGAVTRRRRVLLLEDANIPVDRLGLDQNNKVFLPVHWSGGTHSQNSQSRIWAANTPIRASNFRYLFKQLGKNAVTRLKLYTGTHGDGSGMNWNPITGKRLDGDGNFYLEDEISTKRVARDAGIRIDIIDMGSRTKADIETSLREPGVHVIGSCFGAADEVVMDALNLSQVTLYKLNQSRSRP